MKGCTARGVPQGDFDFYTCERCLLELLERLLNELQQLMTIPPPDLKTG
jgi:hypothetical protein